MPDDTLTERINLPLSPTHLRRIDNWRRRQEEIPTRAAAIRQLLEAGLDAADARAEKHGPASPKGKG